jgi:hypothetical protein
MSPLLFAKVASRWFSRRWWLALASVLGIAMVLATAALGSPRISGTIVGPFVALPWALLCACVWFHPERGNLQPGNRFIGKLPASLQSVLRWYAALFLSFFILVAAVVMPGLALSWLQ